MNKTVCLGITSGIAAYKAPLIARELIRRGFGVQSVMTPNATNFVTKYTMETLTHNPCHVLSFEDDRAYEIEHVSISNKCDIMLVCPATGNFIGKIANGIADDLLTTTVMAFKGKVILAPAMNTQMYNNPIVQDNLIKLRKFGYEIVEPGDGFLACGDHGVGRLAEINDICTMVEYVACYKKDLVGKNILISAGPTQEKIDPVRYITNKSSGKMGFAIAKAAKMRGANVTLVCGPNSLKSLYDVEQIDVITTDDMYKACKERFADSDILIKAGAPCDYRIDEPYENKIKKGDNPDMEITLVPNVDIVSKLAKEKKKEQKVVGFAAESQNLIDNAYSKLENKNLDMIVANNIISKETGFGSDINSVVFITQNEQQRYKGSKLEVAHRLLDLIETV